MAFTKNQVLRKILQIVVYHEKSDRKQRNLDICNIQRFRSNKLILKTTNNQQFDSKQTESRNIKYVDEKNRNFGLLNIFGTPSGCSAPLRSSTEDEAVLYYRTKPI